MSGYSFSAPVSDSSSTSLGSITVPPVVSSSPGVLSSPRITEVAKGTPFPGSTPYSLLPPPPLCVSVLAGPLPRGGGPLSPSLTLPMRSSAQLAAFTYNYVSPGTSPNLQKLPSDPDPYHEVQMLEIPPYLQLPEGD